MKIYRELLQQTPEWKLEKYRTVGGSTLKEVMTNEGKDVAENAVFLDLLGEFLEDYCPEPEKWLGDDVARGNELEPIGREEFERITGKKVHEVGLVKKTDFIVLSPDGLIGDYETLETSCEEALEIKCPSRKVYTSYLVDNQKAVDDYGWQIVMYFLVLGIKQLNLFVFRPENLVQGHILIEITPDTIINISKKKTARIVDLVKDAENRLNELETALSDKVEELTTIKF